MRIANYSFIGLMNVMRSVGKYGKVIDIITAEQAALERFASERYKCVLLFVELR
jgi:hypothetical protein